MTFVSVVTNVLSARRLWPQPRPCHSKTAGTLIIKWQAVRSCRSPSSSLVTGRLKGPRREYSRPSHQPHPMTLLLDKRDTFSLPPFTYIQTLLECFRSLYLSNLRPSDILNVCSVWLFQLSAEVQLPSGENFHLHLHTLHPIIPEQSSFKILSTKVLEVQILPAFKR